MQQFQQQQQQQQQQFSGSTPYSQLPDNARRAIDQIYQLMMQHRRTLASVRTMAPSLLVLDDDAKGINISGLAIATRRGEITSPADVAAGTPQRFASRQQSNAATTNESIDPSCESLPRQMVALQTQIQGLLQSAEANLTEARRLKSIAGEAVAQAKMHGAWPIESVAARSGVVLSSVKDMLSDHSNDHVVGNGNAGGKPASSLNVSGMSNVDVVALQHIMDIRAARVDRIELMPSPYFWEVLKNFEQRVGAATRDVEALRARIAIAEEAERVQSAGFDGVGGRDDASSLFLGNAGRDAKTSLLLQESGGRSVSSGTPPLSRRLATLARTQNDHFLRIAAQAAHAHEGLDEMKLRYQRFCQTTNGGYYEDPFRKADVEEFSRERDLQQRILSEQLATAMPPMAAASNISAAPTAPSVSSSGLFGQPATGLFGAPGEKISSYLFHL
jgi:hypothetical protein